ncbi:hypothetical protein SAMN05421847_1746 [Halpernia humi]|uniref:Uncharacterized protein n=1 Tax=Halpernia humi TaxID=493375 RepID=A0A1H5YB76_9FLAO|nr:hypothetical protein SAMN05421847_1746 [Halpernia humi]
MKAKYLVYLVMISLILRILLNLSIPLIFNNTKIEPLTFGFIGGGVNLLILLSIIGLLIKIFKYQNKNDFLNS